MKNFFIGRAEPLEQQRAKERQAHGETAPGKTLKVDLPEAPGQTRDKVAEKLGISGKQYDKIKTIRDPILVSAEFTIIHHAKLHNIAKQFQCLSIGRE